MFSDSRILALTITVAGLASIFFVLGIVWFVMTISKSVLSAGRNKEKNFAGTVNEVSSEIPCDTADNGSVVAAITAAISAFYAANGTGNTGFRVVSFRRSGSRAWNAK